MAISDWDLITDGTSFLAIETVFVLNGIYTCKCLNTASQNYATFMYSTNQQLQNMETVKVEAIMMGDSDYYTDPSYYPPVNWNPSTLGSTYTASDDTIWKSAAGGSWSNSAVSNGSITQWGLGFGIRIRLVDIPAGGSFFVGLDTSATGIAYSSMDFAFYVVSGSLMGAYCGGYTIQNQKMTPNGTTLSPTDILTLELNASGNMLFKLNGVGFVANTNFGTSVSYPLYAHFCGNPTGSKVSVQMNNATTINYAPNSCPMLFTRLQDDDQSANCYSLINKNDSTSLYKGNINSQTISDKLISTYAVATPSMKTPYQYTLETYNVDANNVKILAKKKYISYYENEITKNTTTDNTTKRRGQNNNTFLVDGGKLGTRCCNFIGAGYINVLYGDYLNTDRNKSIEFWFKARDLTNGCLLSRLEGTYSGNNQITRDFIIYIRNGNLYFTSEWYTTGYSTSPAYPIVSNQWYHVAYTHTYYNSSSSGNYHYFYVNGVLVYTISNVPYPEPLSTTILIGANYPQAYVNSGYRACICNFFNGMIDSFHYIAGTTLSDNEVAARYASQNAGNEVEVHANSKVLYKFEDTFIEAEMINYTDSVNPILNGGKAGFGTYNPTGLAGKSYFDDVKIYTEI